MFGHHSTVAQGRRSWRGLTSFYAWAVVVVLAGLLAPRRQVLTYRIAKLRDRHPDWFRHDLSELIRLLRDGTLHPSLAERIPLADARRAHELLERSAAKGKLVLVPWPRLALTEPPPGSGGRWARTAAPPPHGRVRACRPAAVLRLPHGGRPP